MQYKQDNGLCKAGLLKRRLNCLFIHSEVIKHPGNKQKIFQLTSFLLLQAVKRRVCAAVVGEMKSSNTSEANSKIVKLKAAAYFLFSYCIHLTKLHADVLIWILLPQLIITVCVTHEGENHILNDALEKIIIII